MPRPKVKDNVPISFRIERSIMEKLEAYSKKTGIPKTTIMEQALTKFLNRNSEDSKTD